MITGKKIAIVGLGKEGLSSAHYFGMDNKVWLIDQKEEPEISKDLPQSLQVNVEGCYFGSKIPDVNFDLVVRSPGIRLDNPIITKLSKNGAKITSQVKIFFDEFNGNTIGVTGTKGKGTTSTLIYEILKKAGHEVYLAGNIGVPPLDILKELTDKSDVVLELSSFQLMDLGKSPHITVVLMVTSDHLDWHKDSDEYQRAKETIVKYQKPEDFAVINRDYENSMAFSKKTDAKIYFFSMKDEVNGISLKGDKIVSKIGDKTLLLDIKDIILPGRHNIQNVMAATAVAQILNVENETIQKVIKSFKGLKHRLQIVDEIEGVTFVNDSISTTPETAMAAIEAFKVPKILILGGSGKNSSFNTLAENICRDGTIKAIVLVGQEGPKIKAAIENAGGFSGRYIEKAKSMREIVTKSFQYSTSGEIIILSPACASFDMFKNYEDRGNQFIMEVTTLKNAKSRGSAKK
ncbi:UDP-N-acetylmuramoyl-L-alanine--D-glutamate ligase [Candidatus Curtissbacteria bacterium]|nr:UDP-N-acetylmuramoyl-L-alanine--D-glutamate ligase [Candidatus Curtissbacteria bacterium]